MQSYSEYLSLWRAVAGEFDVPRAAQMELGESVEMRKCLVKDGEEMRVDGSAIIGKPTPYPPILQFRISGLIEESMLPDEPAVHYEWVVRSGAGKLDVALHFHSRDADRNREWLKRVPMPSAFVWQGEVFECEFERFPRPHFRGYRYRLPRQHRALPQLADRAMAHLIANTVNHLRPEWR